MYKVKPLVKDKFRELAASVLLDSHEPLTSVQIRDKVLSLAQERGASLRYLSDIAYRRIHSTLSGDEQRRFRKIRTEPLTWELVINKQRE